MKKQAKKHLSLNIECDYERGNVLVIILIVVALMGALAFTFTRNSGGGRPLLTEGQSKIAASQILKYAKSIENAVKQLQLVNQCSESEISFEINSDPSGYWNDYDHTPTNPSCQIFNIYGGGLSYTPPNKKTLISKPSGWHPTYGYWTLIGTVIVNDVGRLNTGGTPCPGCELLFTTGYISDEVCTELNKQLGYNFSSIPIDVGGFDLDNVPNHFSGSGGYTGWEFFSSAEIDGKKSLCFQESVGDQYNYFYHTLIAR